jgi:hypothetical protein
MEIWKDVEKYESFYAVSNIGNVKNLRSGKILSKTLDKDGYLTCAFSFENNKKTKKYHRLVAEAFILNKENKETVNHIDGNKKNNNVFNLEWATRKDQMIHAVKIGVQKSFKRKVICTKSNKIFESIKEAALFFKINEVTLGLYLRGLRKNKTTLKYV